MTTKRGFCGASDLCRPCYGRRSFSTSRHRMRRVPVLILFGALIAAGSIVALSQDIHRALAQPQGFTKSVEVDRSKFYRLKVKLTYKGEPQDFDIVVGCNVRQINYRNNSRTLEVGLIPSVFGRRMSDGKGLVVRPPRACSGETTANGQVPSDLLPVVVVYDNNRQEIGRNLPVRGRLAATRPRRADDEPLSVA